MTEKRELYVLAGGLAYPAVLWEALFLDAALEHFADVVPQGATIRQAMRAVARSKTPEVAAAVIRKSVSKLLESGKGIALADARQRGTISAVLPVDNADPPR